MDAVQSLLSILLVLGLLGGTLLMLRRKSLVPLRGVQWRMPGMGQTAARRMELIERLSLGPQSALHLVRIGDRTVLVATTPASCQILDAKENTL